MASKPSSDQHSRLSADKRREQLIEVAIDLFSQKGFNGTTTREIAAAAGVTEAIIFRHFETKEVLYRAIMEQKLNTAGTAAWLAEVRKAMDRDDDQSVISQLIEGIICSHKTDTKFKRLMLYAALEGNQIAELYMRQITASIVDAFRSYFSRRQAQGYMCPVGPEAALMSIVGMAQNFAVFKYVHNVSEYCLSDEQAIQSFTYISINGLSTKRPRKARAK